MNFRTIMLGSTLVATATAAHSFFPPPPAQQVAAPAPVAANAAQDHDIPASTAQIFAGPYVPLKDPASAIWGTAHMHTEANGDGAICGTVNARNSFGGYTGDIGYIVRTNRPTLVSETHGERAWARLWARYCGKA